jgi:hypothetical protein
MAMDDQIEVIQELVADCMALFEHHFRKIGPKKTSGSKFCEHAYATFKRRTEGRIKEKARQGGLLTDTVTSESFHSIAIHSMITRYRELHSTAYKSDDNFL